MCSSIALAAAAWCPGAGAALAATSRAIAYAVTGIGIRCAGRDIRHVIAVKVFRIVVYVAIG